MRKVLGPEFFDRPTLTVARDLLGKYLVRKIDGKTVAYMITETEGYMGPKDLASHSSRGRTARTDVMFGPAGVWYVYFIYGMYEMLNVVTKGAGHAVLIRGAEGYNGPGKLTKALNITREQNKKSANKKSDLWVEDRGVTIPPRQIKRTPRIGVAYAGDWAHKPWRFVLAGKQKSGN